MLRALGLALVGRGPVTRVLGINARNRKLVQAYNARQHYPLADDKLRTKEVLHAAGVPVPATYRIFSTMIEARHTAKSLAGFEAFVLKPSQGGGGSGILVLVDRVDGGWRTASGEFSGADQLNRHVADIIFGNYAHGLSDRAYAEELVTQGDLFGNSPFPGLPDIRVILLEGMPLMAMLRIPTLRSNGKANLHQGAVGVGVDIASGKTIHASYKGKSIDCHPDSGEALVGRVLEQWTEILDVAQQAASALPLGYIGLDISIDASRGPLIIEANVRPGLEIQNANRQGLRDALVSLGRGEVLE